MTVTITTAPAPQGWECPKCNAVYSPTTPRCFKCPVAVDAQANDHVCEFTLMSYPAMCRICGAFQPQPEFTFTTFCHEYQLEAGAAGRVCYKCGAPEVQTIYGTNVGSADGWSICNLDGGNRVPYALAHEHRSGFTVYG